jgi:NAD(P)-dependent dehydrogenase (short-subunit alcohol dehydrogenase family)
MEVNSMNKSGKLDSQVALITGGTSGIGKATVNLFAEEGAEVFFTGRRTSLGKTLEQKIRGEGGKATFIAADHTKLEDCRFTVDEILLRQDRIDILFNNAGIVVSGTAEETSENIWAKTLDLNITAVWRMSKFVLPIMRQQGGGAIINNASDWGIVGGKQAVAYCTSKGAVIQMTKAMALDHARENIRINAICPGDTNVERWETEGYFEGSGGVDKVEISASSASIPLGRVARADEIARAVLFLACDDSSYITGIPLLVDGGNTAG